MSSRQVAGIEIGTITETGDGGLNMSTGGSADAPIVIEYSGDGSQGHACK